MKNQPVDFSALLGETLTHIVGCRPDSEEITIKSLSGRMFRMYHAQNCCETVSIESVVGDVEDILDSPILHAEESSGDRAVDRYAESYTWTFYRLTTIKGSIVIRWLGVSNGYYSESVDFCEVA